MTPHLVANPHPRRSIIGLVAPPGVGKTTLAKGAAELIRQAGYTVEIMSFADPLRDIAIALTPNLVAESFTVDRKNVVRHDLNYRTPRKVLNDVADELRTSLGDQVFVHAMNARVMASDADVIIIDDVRFLQESEWLYSLNVRGSKIRPIPGMYSVIVRLVRELPEQRDIDFEHRSETESGKIVERFTIDLDTVTVNIEGDDDEWHEISGTPAKFIFDMATP